MQLSRLGLLVSSLVGSIAAQSTFSPARPPSLPLAVKSPYLSTWQDAGSDGGDGGYLAGQWPTFWQNQITGWCGMIRVDNNTYTWMGLPGTTTVNQTAFEYTSTKSIFTMDVEGVVEMKITFLSPLTPNDLKRQSLIFSYMDVEVYSLDGNHHQVQIYSDISAEWISGDRSAIAQWDYGTTDGIGYHKVYRQTQLEFSEVDQQGEWGNWYYATDATKGVSFQSGEDTVVRGQFESNGVLADSQDTNYRAISDDWPVFGFTANLGSVGSRPVSTLFTIGLCQEDAVQFNGTSGYNPVPSLWTSYFDSDLEALSFFYKDYYTFSSMSSAFDNQISHDSASAISQDYATITSLAARQVFGATQLCGTPEKMYLFLKEISSDGNVNTVDVIFPAYPAFLYSNPDLLKLVLEPLFEIQEAGDYPNAWAMHDIGSTYPNATGHPTGNDEKMPLEECGNMVIMALAYAQKAHDTSYLSQYYSLLEQWTGYLVDDALYPANQISTDDFAGALANQTNLALKGMIGIQAMSEIARLTGRRAEAANYSRIAHSYIAKWQDLAINKNADPPHSTLNYNNWTSHGLLYNLYADAQLGLNLVPRSVYDMQSVFYPTVENDYGVPLDTRHTYTKLDWESLCAAIADSSTQTMFITDLVKWINETPTNMALTDLYDTITGDYPGIYFIARPVVGGTFGALLLNQS